MTSRMSNPAVGDLSNPWEEYSKFHDACAAIVDKVELRADQNIPLTASEQTEFRTMVLNLGMLGKSLHGKRARDMRDLAERASRALERCGLEGSAQARNNGEPEQDPAIAAS